MPILSVQRGGLVREACRTRASRRRYYSRMREKKKSSKCWDDNDGMEECARAITCTITHKYLGRQVGSDLPDGWLAYYYYCVHRVRQAWPRVPCLMTGDHFRLPVASATRAAETELGLAVYRQCVGSSWQDRRPRTSGRITAQVSCPTNWRIKRTMYSDMFWKYI